MIKNFRTLKKSDPSSSNLPDAILYRCKDNIYWMGLQDYPEIVKFIVSINKMLIQY